MNPRHDWEENDHYPRQGGLCTFCVKCGECKHTLGPDWFETYCHIEDEGVDTDS